jgi:hypothetical protein
MREEHFIEELKRNLPDYSRKYKNFEFYASLLYDRLDMSERESLGEEEVSRLTRAFETGILFGREIEGGL